MKRTKATKNPMTTSVCNRILAAVRADAIEETDWSSLVKPLGLPPKAANDLAAALATVVRLPFADSEKLADLLLFQQVRLPKLRSEPGWTEKTQQLGALFELMIGMAMQGNSLFPQNPADIASQLRDALESTQPSPERFAALIALLLSSDRKMRTGLNFTNARNLEEVVEYEHRRRSRNPEWCWKSPKKYSLLEIELKKQPEFRSDWKFIQTHFYLDRFRDADGIIRRSPLVEGNWRRPNPSDLRNDANRFQVVFNFFCWKWFLYGMRGNEPMLQKLAVTLTPFGTQIFIPGFRSLDPARDINWAKVTRLHRARGINKQGEKLAEGREAHRKLVDRIVQADRTARQNGLKGVARYDYIKRQAGLSPETDDAEIRQYLRKAVKKIET
jgi:hypothetical protein